MRLLLLIFALISTSLQAIWPLFQWGRFEVWGEALYMKPLLSDLNYAIADAREGIGEPALPYGRQLTLSSDFQWGWRVGIGYMLCPLCADLRAQYTNLQTRTRREPSTPSYWPTFGSPGVPGTLNHPFGGAEGTESPTPLILRGRSRLDLDALDIEVGKMKVLQAGTLLSRVHFGIHYAHLESCLDVNYQGTLPGQSGLSGDFSSLEARSIDFRRSWGVGPRLGVDLRAKVSSHMGLSLRFCGTLLSGNQRGKCEQSNISALFQEGLPVDFAESTLLITSRNRVRLFPRFGGRIGVTFASRCDCLTVRLEAGYEIITYLRCFARPTLLHRASIQGTASQSYYAHGVFIRLGAQI